MQDFSKHNTQKDSRGQKKCNLMTNKSESWRKRSKAFGKVQNEKTQKNDLLHKWTLSLMGNGQVS